MNLLILPGGPNFAQKERENLLPQEEESESAASNNDKQVALIIKKPSYRMISESEGVKSFESISEKLHISKSLRLHNVTRRFTIIHRSHILQEHQL